MSKKVGQGTRLRGFSKREMEIIESLKVRDIKETAKLLGMKRGNVDRALYVIRNKIELARDMSNNAANWLDSGKYPRLGKILRRDS